jgi:hypothetical protein
VVRKVPGHGVATDYRQPLVDTDAARSTRANIMAEHALIRLFADRYWKDADLRARYPCLGNLTDMQGALPCIGMVHLLKSLCDAQGKPKSIGASQQVQAIINTLLRKRGRLPALELCMHDSVVKCRIPTPDSAHCMSLDLTNEYSAAWAIFTCSDPQITHFPCILLTPSTPSR